MRYFTKDMWRDAQTGVSRGGEQARVNQDGWQRASDDYGRQLELLQSRLSSLAFEFFYKADVHDGELLDLHVIDGSRPAPIGEPPRPWKSSSEFPVRVELTVLDAYERFVWHLCYARLRRVVVDFPTSDPLFYSEGTGFGDWGYDELTDAGEGFLRHEVLFATGATLLFEFQTIELSRTERSGNPA